MPGHPDIPKGSAVSRWQPSPDHGLRRLRPQQRPGVPGSWISLIDRGFVFAQAHVRGGQEKGARWYAERPRAPQDKHVQRFHRRDGGAGHAGLRRSRRMFAHGASAGGLIVGAVAKPARPLRRRRSGNVPPVDHVTTMSDPTLPAHHPGIRGVGQPGGQGSSTTA